MVPDTVPPQTVVDDDAPRQSQREPAVPLRFKSNSISQKSSTNPRKHAKRLTLQFPIVISDSAVPHQQANRHQKNKKASDGDAAMFFQAPKPESVDLSLVNPSGLDKDETHDGTAFFTALAAQERKVLELREELQKAEAELTSLKRQWAVSERSKKRSEIRFQTEAMKSMRRPSTDTDPGSRRLEDVSVDALREQARFSRELGRRGSLTRHSPSLSITSNASASPRATKPRTVFQGSRHTRTLSLLSNSNNNNNLSFPQPTDIRNKTALASKPLRSVTLPNIDVTNQSVLSPQSQPPDSASLKRYLAQNPTAEAFMKTGQQMAADFKDNLWTFLEDIRQATVGEELTRANSRSAPASGAGSKSESKNSRRSTGRSVSGPVSGAASGQLSPARNEEEDAAFWKQFGLEVRSPMSSRSGSRKATPRPSGQPNASPEKQQETSLLDFDDDDDDTWDMWDNSPVNHSRSGKAISHTPCSSTSTWPSKRSQSPSTAASSPPMSASFTDLHQPVLIDNNSFHEETNSSDHSNRKSRSGSIPWPALKDLAPSKLTKTASTLMAEWEHSLTPSPERVVSPKAAKAD